jgi:UPF0716 family protein affecting phage T7 exclusion
VVNEVSVVTPAVSVVVISAVGLAIDNQPKSEMPRTLAALEIVKDLVIARAGLCVLVPGLVAVILQIPAASTRTKELFMTLHVVGVFDAAVVTPAV